MCVTAGALRQNASLGENSLKEVVRARVRGKAVELTEKAKAKAPLEFDRPIFIPVLPEIPHLHPNVKGEHLNMRRPSLNMSCQPGLCLEEYP